jgi:hypothetical protein
MRRRLLWTVFLSALLAGCLAGAAFAAKPTVVRAGNLVITLNGGFSPMKLPKHRFAPITLSLSGGIATTDGSQPPAAKTVTIDFDKHGTINAKGLPVCKQGKLEAQTTAAAKKACPKAIVGTGKTTVRVAFPEQKPFESAGPLVLFNGGVKGGVTTMFIHAYVNVPAPTALVTIVKIKKIHSGKFGTQSVATIPTIAGGSGSLIDYALTIHRTFTSGGKKQAYLVAECATGKLFAHGTVAFENGTQVSGTVVRPCTPAG